MVMTMRLRLALASKLADARCNNEKARALIAGEHQATRAVVSVLDKATGVSAANTRAGLTPTHPGKRTQLKLARSLSLRRPVRSIGVGNERPTIRETSPSN
jgi:hypothetical protein